MGIAFDQFEIDLERFELRRAGERVALEPQVFEVLAYLVTHPDRVVTKNELMDEVWGSRFVSESALTSRIKTARQALGDDGRTQRFIRTVHGRGYRFLGAPADAHDEVVDSPDDDVERAARTNLPVDRTPLFGRHDDIERVAAALDDHRLVCLLGIGGTGKTRLAVATAGATAPRWPDGTWFVDLVPVDDAAGIEVALAEAASLRLGSGGDMRGQLARLLREHESLIVIDNAEHVIDEVADVLDDLLEQTVEPRFLVTSREPLNLPDERRIAIAPLSVDDLELRGPAVELLVSSAERFGTELDDVDEHVLHRICRSLDGLPLAIELASAQLRHLDAPALADRLDRRFELLTHRSRGADERHASLLAVLADTWNALPEPQQRLLEQLAAFPATFTLDDLCAVADGSGAAIADAELTLGDLVDRSLVVRESGRRTSRYRLLETVKLFAQQQCDDARRVEVAEAHADWCLRSVGDDVRRYLFDFDLASWCAEHHSDLRTAGRFLMARGDADLARKLFVCTALAMHVDTGARAATALDTIDRHLAAADDPAARTLLHVTGAMCGMAARDPTAIADHGRLAESSARQTDDPVLQNAALVVRSWSTVFIDPEQALTQTDEASDLAAAADEPLGRDFADGYRAFHLAVLRRYDEAEAVARAVVERAPAEERPNYPTHVGATALSVLLSVEAPEEALRLFEDLLGSQGGRVSMWGRDLLIAAIHALNGDPATASAIAERIHARMASTGRDPWPDLLLPAIAAAVQVGDYAHAATWLDAIRNAGQPTQSFQATVLYRRLRERTADADAGAVEAAAEVDDATALEAIGADALAWLRDRA